MLESLFCCITLLIIGWFLGAIFNNCIITTCFVAIVIYWISLDSIKYITLLKAWKNKPDFSDVIKKTIKRNHSKHIRNEYFETEYCGFNNIIKNMAYEIPHEISSNFNLNFRIIYDCAERNSKELWESLFNHRKFEKELVNKINDKYSVFYQHFISYPEKELFFLCESSLEGNKKSEMIINGIIEQLSTNICNYARYTIIEHEKSFLNTVKERASNINEQTINNIVLYLKQHYPIEFDNYSDITCGACDNFLHFCYHRLDLSFPGQSHRMSELDGASLAYAILNKIAGNSSHYNIVFRHERNIDGHSLDFFNSTYEEMQKPCYIVWEIEIDNN